MKFVATGSFAALLIEVPLLLVLGDLLKWGDTKLPLRSRTEFEPHYI